MYIFGRWLCFIVIFSLYFLIQIFFVLGGGMRGGVGEVVLVFLGYFNFQFGPTF